MSGSAPDGVPHSYPEDCIKYRCHILAVPTEPVPVVIPQVAFCDKDGIDKTHHIDLNCPVIAHHKATRQASYYPRTKARVIMGLYPLPCPECKTE